MRAAGFLHESCLVPVIRGLLIYHSSGRDINPLVRTLLLDNHYTSGQSPSILGRVLVPALAIEGLPVAPNIHPITNSHIAL